MPVWIGMMVPVSDEHREKSTPIVIEFNAGVWDNRLGLLPLLDRLERAHNVSCVTVLVAETKETAIAEMSRRMAALNLRVSPHIDKFNEFMHYCKTHDKADEELKAKAYRVTPERIHEIDSAMKAADGVAKIAAKALHMPSSTLHYYLKRKELRHWRAIKNERAEHAARILQVL